MITTPGFSQKTIGVGGRTFLVNMLKFDNGRFVSINEGGNRLGAMTVSLATGPTPITSSVIPAKSESLFLKLVAERLSSSFKGIGIVTISISKELDSNSAKTLMGEIEELSRVD